MGETTPPLQAAYQRLGPTPAVRRRAQEARLPAQMKPPQWGAYASLDPKPRQSGTSVEGPRPIAQVGNTQLRTALFIPAWVAGRHHRHIQAFYQKRIDAGHKPKQALVAVMRKLRHTI